MLTVQTIVNIAAQAEKVFDHRYHFDLLMEQSLHAGDVGASPAGARWSKIHSIVGACRTAVVYTSTSSTWLARKRAPAHCQVATFDLPP